MSSGDMNNGDKSKIIWFLLGLLQAITFWWGTKLDANVASMGTRVTTLEVKLENIQNSINKIGDRFDVVFPVRKGDRH